MSTQQVLNLNPQISITALDNVLKGLEQTTELAYLRRVAGRHGFDVTTRWNSTVDNIKNIIVNPSPQKPYASFSNLKLITLKIITSINHYYSIDYIKGGDTTKIPSMISFKNFDQAFSSVFPSKLEDGNGLPKIAGNYITAIEDMGDGIAFIFSCVILKKINGKSKMRSNEYAEQYFNTVFIPNDLSRIEYRVDKNLGRRIAEKELVNLRNEFINFMAGLRVNLVLETVNFFNAIAKIYSDKQYGRLVQVDFLDPNGDEDAVLRCRTDPKYDARYRQVVATSQGNTAQQINLKVSGVAVRLDSKLNNETISNEIGFQPSKSDWANNQFCGTFYFTQAADHSVHYGVINDILKRAK
ncbi:hypothetical protein [Rahnella ecdela]|uniref:Uncharacterized protein n=1 Tax=Rahnella ecdela TaxID=2816250 RepID=A0ABS6LJQ5_9GAMM|nr:hypothetical protein [Rahnella ecdela]MBU9847141.1 hypothetical protein [Rahnella ecdela]